MREIFEISDDVEVRLYLKEKSNTYQPLNNCEQTVQEAGLYSDNTVIIEARNRNRTWPRGGTGEGYVHVQ